MGRQIEYLKALSRKDDPVSRVWVGYYMTWGHPGMVRTQAVVRGFLVRRHMKKVMRGRLVSGFAREESAARCIQRHWRGWQQRMAYLDLYLDVVPPVVEAQRIVRGWLARREYRKLQAHKRRLDPYATTIQRCYRGRLGRRMALLRRIELLEYRRELVRRRFVAIVVTQKCARRWLAKARAAKLRLRRLSAAVALQRHFRGWATRRRVSALRLEKNAASGRIQRWARGWLARRELQRLKWDRDREHVNRQNAAAITIQRIMRGWYARSTVLALRMNADDITAPSSDVDSEGGLRTSSLLSGDSKGSVERLSTESPRPLGMSASSSSASTNFLRRSHSNASLGLVKPVGGGTVTITQQHRPSPPTPPSAALPRSLSVISSSSRGLGNLYSPSTSMRRSAPTALPFLNHNRPPPGSASEVAAAIRHQQSNSVGNVPVEFTKAQRHIAERRQIDNDIGSLSSSCDSRQRIQRFDSLPLNTPRQNYSSTGTEPNEAINYVDQRSMSSSSSEVHDGIGRIPLMRPSTIHDIPKVSSSRSKRPIATPADVGVARGDPNRLLSSSADETSRNTRHPHPAGDVSSPVEVYATSVSRESSSALKVEIERPDKLGPLRNVGGMFDSRSQSTTQSPYGNGYVSGVGGTVTKLPPLRVTKRTPKALWNAAVRNFTSGADLRWTA